MSKLQSHKTARDPVWVRKNPVTQLEHFRWRLTRRERDLDDALRDDYYDDTGARLVAERLQEEWKILGRFMPEDLRVRMERLMHRICVHADWQKWPQEMQPHWVVETACPLFSRAAFADITTSRQKDAPRCTQILGAWIDGGDINLAKHIYNAGDAIWREFALLHLSYATNRFFADGGVLRKPGNWPGLVLAFAHEVLETSATANPGNYARQIAVTIENIRDRHVAQAVRNARAPFMR